MKTNADLMDDRKYDVKERRVIGRNGSQYYAFISQWTIDNALKSGDAIIMDGLPKAINNPWKNESY